MCSDRHHRIARRICEIVCVVWSMKILATLNEVFSTLSVRRRYEVWFLRVGLADGSGAWWFRYLLMNPGRGGCAGNPQGMPVQVWATWFPAGGKPQSFIQGFPLQGLDISGKGQSPFHFRIGDNGIEEDSCRGALDVDGHSISWNLRYRSTFRVTLSNKGWIGFSRTPHSDAAFSGQITLRWPELCRRSFRVRSARPQLRIPASQLLDLDPRVFSSDRPARQHVGSAWSTRCRSDLVFRKAVLWHDGKQYVFRNLRETVAIERTCSGIFSCADANGSAPGRRRSTDVVRVCIVFLI